MKHSTKIILLVSAGLVSFGLILSAIGLICGGSLSNIMNHGLWRFTGYQKIHYDNTFDKDNTYHVSASSIHSIDVDWIDGDISVVPYDGDDIILTESSNKELDDEYCLRYRIKSGKLLIEYCKSKYYIGLDLSEEDNFPIKTLEIKVPKGLAKICRNSVSTQFPQMYSLRTSGRKNFPSIPSAETFPELFCWLMKSPSIPPPAPWI